MKEVFTSGQRRTFSEGEHLPEDDPEAPDVGVGRVDVVIEAFKGQPLDGDVGLKKRFIDFLLNSIIQNFPLLDGTLTKKIAVIIRCDPVQYR